MRRPSCAEALACMSTQARVRRIFFIGIGLKLLLIYLEVVFKEGLCLPVLVVDVVDNPAVFQKHDASGDVDGVLQVVAAHEDGRACLLVVFLQQVLDGILAAGVKEVEGLVEDEHLRSEQHCSHDAHLLLVACAERAYELLLPFELARHEVPVPGKEVLQLLVAGVGQAGNELEVFVGREVVNEEALVDKGSCPVLPVFRLGNIDVDVAVLELACHADGTAVGLDEVEDETEERTLAGTIVAHQSKQLTAVDCQFWNVNGNFLAEGLLEVFYLDFHLSVIILSSFVIRPFARLVLKHGSSFTSPSMNSAMHGSLPCSYAAVP